MKVEITNPWSAIVGRGPEGRNTMIHDVAGRLVAAGLSVRGYTHVGVEVESGPGIDALELFGDRVAGIARSCPDPEICNYHFPKEAFAEVATWCVGGEVLFVELGRLEAAGGGYWPMLAQRCVGPRTLLVLSIRPHVLASIALDLPDPAAFVELPYEAEAAERFAEELLEVWHSGRMSQPDVSLD